MILTCPACTMRYLVAEGAIGPDGRAVRCAHCGHQWFEEGEEGLDEALFGSDPPDFLEEEQDQDHDDDQAFEPSVSPEEGDDDFQSILRKEIETTPIPEGVRPKHEDIVLPAPSAAKSKKKMSGDKIGGLVTAVVIWAVALAVMFIMQPQISRAWPPSNLLYNLVGLKPVPPGEGLSLESLHAEMADGKIIMKGDIINLREDEADVPSVMATIVDKNAKVIDRILIAPPIARLKPEGQASFNVVYPKIPDGAQNVNFGFSYVKVKAEETPETQPEPAPANPAPHKG